MTIKLARQSGGLTQKQLADKTGINIRQIQKVEAGEIKVSNLTAANYIHLCRVLRLDPQTQIMEGYKMTRDTAKELQRKYNMEITRHPVTSEAWALTVDSEDLIPELDDLADGAPDIALPCAMTRALYGDTYRYQLACPTSWFDLWGWADE